jgi:Uma2 family endonuclease
MDPTPGTATVKDLKRCVEAVDKRLVELIDGTLVEKAMGTGEALLGGILFTFLANFVDENDLGECFPADGLFRILPKKILAPDLSFFTWERLPENLRGYPKGIPDLVAEVLSESNRADEMKRRLRDFFKAGVRLVWYIDPRSETVEVYTSPTENRTMTRDDTLDGGEVLPGFSLHLSKLFRKPGQRRKEGNK